MPAWPSATRMLGHQKAWSPATSATAAPSRVARVRGEDPVARSGVRAANSRASRAGVVGSRFPRDFANSVPSRSFVPISSGTGCAAPDAAASTRVHRQELAVDDRREAQHTGRRLVRPLVEQGARGDELVGRRLEQGVDGVLLLRAEQPDQLRGPAGRALARVRRGGRRALGDRPVEQAAGGGYRHQRRHRDAARRLAEDRHVAGVAAERGDVVAHPLQRRDLVAEAEVGVERPLGRGVAGDVGEPERAEPVVERDVDDVAGAGERVPGVPRHGRRPHAERAAVDPHHHRPRRAGRRRRDHVDRQAVFAHRGAAARAEQVEPAALLRRHRAERGRVAHARPRLRRPGRPEPPLPRRRRRVRDAAPHAQVVADRDAAHHARSCAPRDRSRPTVARPLAASHASQAVTRLAAIAGGHDLRRAPPRTRRRAPLSPAS